MTELNYVEVQDDFGNVQSDLMILDDSELADLEAQLPTGWQIVDANC